MNTAAQDIVKLDSADDIALADKMNAARGQIVAELKKLIIGQDATVDLILLSLFVGEFARPSCPLLLLPQVVTEVEPDCPNARTFAKTMPNATHKTNLVPDEPSPDRRCVALGSFAVSDIDNLLLKPTAS